MRAGLAHGIDLCPRGDSYIVARNDTGHYGSVQVAIAVWFGILWGDEVCAAAKIPQLVVVLHTRIDHGYLYAFTSGKGMEASPVIALIFVGLRR